MPEGAIALRKARLPGTARAPERPRVPKEPGCQEDRVPAELGCQWGPATGGRGTRGLGHKRGARGQGRIEGKGARDKEGRDAKDKEGQGDRDKEGQGDRDKKGQGDREPGVRVPASQRGQDAR